MKNSQNLKITCDNTYAQKRKLKVTTERCGFLQQIRASFSCLLTRP